jgi:hypothetical protein
MQKFSKVFVAVAIVAGIIVIGGLIGWLGGKASGSKPGAVLETSAASDPRSATRRPVDISQAGHPEIEPRSPPGFAGASPTGSTPNVLANWEEKVDEILGAETDDTNKVKQLFALFPRVPEEAKAEVAQHLSNLTSDQDYAPLGELLKDPKQPDAALDVLMADALNRPNSVKLPELLDVARTPDHPKADEAKDILALFLDEDFGTDWSKWQDKMTAWLKDNPD